MSTPKHRYPLPHNPVIVMPQQTAVYETQYDGHRNFDPSYNGPYITTAQYSPGHPEQSPAIENGLYDSAPTTFRHASPYPPQHNQQNSYAITSTLPPQDGGYGWDYSPAVQQPESSAYPASCENIQYEPSEMGGSSDERSLSSITSSVPTPKSFPSTPSRPLNHKSYMNDAAGGSPSSGYAPGSMSPATNISGTFGSTTHSSHPAYPAAGPSGSYPSPYSPPQTQMHAHTRLTPVLSNLSIEGQQLRYSHSPLSGQGSSMAYPSPQSGHRRSPSSAQSVPHDLSPQHHSSSLKSQPSSHTDSSRPNPTKQMVPGTPTHPDIPRPALVASPVPVPNLIKKSRGRQVPSVSAVPATSQAPPAQATQPLASPSTPTGYYYTPGSSSLAGWGGDEKPFRPAANGPTSSSLAYALGAPPATPYPGPGEVMNAADMEGCGKAYIRAEHLKRHVRSIHTNDKPYECPHPGCGREFSRYDNLCQHFKGVHGPQSTLRNQPGQ
ncbi:hypothetical protein BS47DRAFT_1360238 [Hydnum rufescens UP504]|uniref:C2H2-type domain-containing protein n=1 Tax=Hydnum rufescens UP504 TaxID=1448309 RepID=A0A9P6DWN2_9AGAM|nr:hypothetical protein BS47DRAFT_1360238 [Hydnum rufescens UP504]